MSPIRNFPSPKLADKKRDRVRISTFRLKIVKTFTFWWNLSNFDQKGQFLTHSTHGIFSYRKTKFLDFPVNLDIVEEIISELNRRPASQLQCWHPDNVALKVYSYMQNNTHSVLNAEIKFEIWNTFEGMLIC